MKEKQEITSHDVGTMKEVLQQVETSPAVPAHAELPGLPEPEETALTPTEETALYLTDENKLVQPGTAAGFFEDVATRRMWFNAKTKAESLAVIAAMDNTDYQLADCLGQVIEVIQIIAHETQFETKEKGLISAIRTVIIDAKGKSYGSVADGVRDSVAGLFHMVGMPPYDPPILLTPIEKPTRQGFKTLKLIPVVSIL